MTPTITTDSMRMLDDKFDYVLLATRFAVPRTSTCIAVVESEESYKNWLESQEEFLADKDAATETDARAEATNNGATICSTLIVGGHAHHEESFIRSTSSRTIARSPSTW